MEKYIYFNGLKFTKDDNTGYYLNSTKKKRLHRAVWEYYNGEIPKGHHIHHIDEDKSNNDISNLALLSSTEHLSHHGNKRALNYYDELVENLNNNARPKANEWHGSNEGKDWHKKHYENTKDKLHKKSMFECLQCHRNFIGIDNGNNKFCTNKCKSKWRRLSGIDDVVKECIYCGKSFTKNKYSKAITCSRSCTNRQRAKIRKNKKYQVS